MKFEKIKENHYIPTIVLFILIWLFVSNPLTAPIFEARKAMCYVMLLVAYVGILVFQYQIKGKISDYSILLGGFLFQFIFVTVTGYLVCTHDMGTFPGFDTDYISAGHLGYIGYLFNYEHLPDFNPMSVWGFYHPPLHFIISAIWLKINVAFGLSEAMCLENLQLLMMLYSMLSLCVLYSILKELGFDGRKKRMWLLFISFFPFFFYNAASLTNDTLSILFALVAVLYTIKWYHNQTIKNIVILAFAIGLGMMTKLTVGLLAPATAFVFLVVLWRRRQEWKKMFAQFVTFGVICVPLGLWWSIRNAILHEMPIGYVQEVLASAQEVSMFSVWDRIFPSLQTWLNPFMTYNNFTWSIDYGIFSTMIKSALFCDFPFFAPTQWEYQLCRIFIFLTLILFIMALVTFVWKVCEHVRYKQWNDTVFWFASIALVVQLVMYISFAFNYPVVCSADFRYIVPIIGYFLIISRATNVVEKNDIVNSVKKVFCNIAESLVMLFAIISVVLYTICLLGLAG